MIFIMKPDGTIMPSIPSPVYQGANGTNVIYLFAPSMVGNSATVAFRTPDGVWTEREPMTLVANLPEEFAKYQYCVWQYTIGAPIARLDGVVTVQFFFYANGAILPSSASSFVIGRGVPVILPPEPAQDVYDQILQAISAIQKSMQYGDYAARAIFEWRKGRVDGAAISYGIGEFTYVPAGAEGGPKGKTGSFIKSLVDKNTQPPYVDGKLNGGYWEEVVNFDYLEEKYFSDLQNLADEAEGYKNAAEAAQSGALTAKDAAEKAQESALAAKEAAETAETSARESAQAAAASESQAAASERNAAAHEHSAQAAEQGAVKAQQAAEEAAEKAAVEVKEDLQTLKNEAQEAAKNAQAAEQGAIDAKNAANVVLADTTREKEAAEAAKEGALTAQKGAETAQSGALAAKAGAETAQRGALDAKEAAEAAQQGALTAKSEAEKAKAAAEAARQGAITAKEQAQAAAEQAADNVVDQLQEIKKGAEAAQQGAIAAKNEAQQAAQSAQSAAETAAENVAAQLQEIKEETEAAKQGAITAKDEAEKAAQNAQTAAEQAAENVAAQLQEIKEETEAAKQGALTAKGEAEKAQTAAEAAQQGAIAAKEQAEAAAGEAAGNAVAAVQEELQDLKEGAEAAQTNAQRAAQSAQTAQAAAEAAKDRAVQAQDAVENAESSINTRLNSIEEKIPPQASKDNLLVDTAKLNSSLNSFAAFYLSYNAAGDPFPTKASLDNAITFYYEKKPRTPTRNDYVTVLSDESQEADVNGTYPTTRYTYQGDYPNGQWTLSFIVNNTSFTAAQLEALNSGLSKESLEQIEENKKAIAAETERAKAAEQKNATAAATAQSTAEAAQDAATAAQNTADAAAASATDAKNTANTAKDTADAASSTAADAKKTAEAASTAASAAQKAAEAAETSAAEAKETADSAKSTADEAQKVAAAAQSAAATAKSTADTAQETATAAQEAAETAQSTADGAKKAADAAQKTADAAQETATAAQSAAATAQSTADSAQDAAEAAQSTADAAKKAAATAQSSANAAQSTADAAQTAANAAQETADSANAAAKTAQSTADAAKSAAEAAQKRADASVRYDEAQTLTDAQKKRARDNIGAGDSGFSGKYADLEGAPKSLPPSGAAGGDLSGTYPNPEIATGKVTREKCSSNVQNSLNAADAAMPKSGGKFTGRVSWQESSLPAQTTSPYFVTIESFSSGGKTYYTAKEYVKEDLGVNAAQKTATAAQSAAAAAQSTADTAKSAAAAAQSKADNAVPSTDKGKAGGVASLGTDGKVPEAQLPATYDLVIRSQSQFEAWYKRLDAGTFTGHSVLILGGTYTRSDGKGLHLPTSLKQIHGVGIVKIIINSFVYNVNTNKAAIWYTTTPTTKEYYSIENISLDYTGSYVSGRYIYGFYSCTNLTNCTASGSGYDGYGFYSCTNLTNCTASGSASVSGFHSCTNLTNCTASSSASGSLSGTASASTSGFYSCTNLTNCTASVSAYGDGCGFLSCTNLTNCTASGSASGSGSLSGYGFYSCRICSNCRQDPSNASKTATWGGTNTNVDWRTCPEYIDHEYHIFYDNTKPKDIYGGDWEELPQGTFLRAVGTNGATTSGTATNGGSNSVTLKEENLPNMYGYLAGYEQWVGLGQFTNGDPSMKGAFLDKGNASYYGTSGRGWSVAYGNEIYPAGVSKGNGQSFDNQPQYKNCHIWKRKVQ